MDAEEGVLQEGILEQVGSMERWQEGVRDRVVNVRRDEEGGIEEVEVGGNTILNLKDS